MPILTIFAPYIIEIISVFSMKQYKTINNLTGWLVFIIAATVYCMTVEPTASFWDCPEFITTGYKLEIGHPPGAPFFMLTANLFSQFASDPAMVAKMVNYMSALLSAACILFLFWTITHLAKKLIAPNNEMTKSQIITIMASGMVGALAYTFSDTFWFSAVEGEVYAYSSMFTAVVFWLILKWEDVADQPHSDRWLVLIAYLIGLSIGVHLLNLLCIPAIVLVYYFKKKPNATGKGALTALVGSMLIIAAVLYGIVPGAVKVGGWFELLFVNGMGFSFNTGVIVYIVLLTASILWGVYESYTAKSQLRMNISFLLTVAFLGIPFYGHGTSSVIIGIIVLALLAIYLFAKSINEKYKISARTLNTTMLCIMMIMVGYSSYALIVIRSTSNTPMDQNSPEDIFTLGEYLGREQYGTRPLFYGQTYASKPALEVKDGYCIPKSVKGAPVYQRKEKATPDEKDSYEIIRYKMDYVYAQNMLFPRMYSDAHAKQYESWMDIKGHEVTYDQCGEIVKLKIPTMWENIRFFFTYQLNFMYWRYFMWNFAGRQNDIQGNGEIEHGNWITGFKFIDNLLVGNQELLPEELANNKGRNVFYCLPLLLGIIGLLWQMSKDNRGVQDFWVVFFLFFMTGIAIVIYLNQTPLQPRERDYAYAGSFYAFAIWIGMGVAGIAQLFMKKLKALPAAIIAGIACLFVPIQMASQTWDDHDRSGRYVCRDFGQNYLSTLPEEGAPIIYTNGDNDTFPLWYNQETENFRTDARVCNLSYLQTDWYIDQMKRPAYDSPALPITWNRLEYVQGTNEYVPIRPEVKQQVLSLYKSNPEMAEHFGENPFELKNILKHWVRNPNKDFQVIPTDSIIIPLDKEAIQRSGMMIPEALGDSIPDTMVLSLKGKHGLYKSELMMLEMLANANWERPIYMAITVGSENHLNLGDNFMQEGLAYRITPFNTTTLNARVDSEKMFDNLMHKYKFGGIENPDVYLDENIRRMCYTHRRMFALLVKQLLAEGKIEKAEEALEYCEKVIPATTVPHDYQSGSKDLAEAWLKVGKADKAATILDDMANKAVEYITWYLSMRDRHLLLSSQECLYHLYLMDDFTGIMDENGLPEAEEYAKKFNDLYGIFMTRVGDKIGYE